CVLTFVLLLPFSISFILPHFGFFGAGKFVNDPFQPTKNVLYENTKIYNLIRLAGIGDYHIGELGYNELRSPINLVGFILCVSVIVVLLSIFYNDRYRRKLKEITSKTPAKFDSL